MSSDLIPQEERITRALMEKGLRVHVGDVFIADDYTGYNLYLRVEAVRVDEDGTVRIRLARRCPDGSWKDYATKTVEDFAKEKYVRLDQPIAEFEQQALAALSDPHALDLWAEGQASDSTELAATGGTQSQALRYRDAVQEQLAKVEAFRRIVEAKAHNLQGIVHDLEKKLGQANRILGAFELYLGVYEEITQIRTGEPAAADDPIYLFQQVLYMDEEVGTPRRKNDQAGIDFQSIEDFDAWVAQPEHCAQVLPTSKGLRALKVSRQDRTYSPNPWFDHELRRQNQMVYLLVRNGDQLYRIWTSITMGPRLFPGPEEAQQVFTQARDDNGWMHTREAAQDKEFLYKRNGLLMQGLLDRTPVLQPMSHPINLFDPETYGGLVETVFDDEPALHTGREAYREWKARLNQQIRRGTRIILTIRELSRHLGEKRDRFLYYYSDDRTAPPLPKSGVYTVEEVLPARKSLVHHDRADRLVIRYDPGDWASGDWYREQHRRKVRVGFFVFWDEPFVFNYDLITLEDVEYYLQDRLGRKDYLDMMPVLYELRERRLQELSWEKDFVALVAHRLECGEDIVWQAVEWWKRKVTWTRPITQDDAKALRMIEQRIRRQQAAGQLKG